MSEKYIVSARKYRPASFATVVGQKALTHTLKTAIASGRLAHAYLFCGPRGVGKTTCARIFAKTINCQHPTADGEACNECESCRAFNEQRSYNVTELDAASNNSVDNIRDLTDQVRIPPASGKYRVYIIDEVHMLSSAAFNAFLKTLEEPPEYAIFILATTEKQKVIPTILSRCQIYDFARITVPDIVEQLQYICQQEDIAAEPAALNVIAQKADGAMRDALSIFDQVAASSQGNITYRSAIENLNVLDYDYYFRLIDAILAADVQQALMIYKEVRDHGFDSLFFVGGLAQHIRDLMVASDPRTMSLLEMNQEVGERYVAQAAKLGPRFFYIALDLLNTCDFNYRNASNKLLLVELTLIKLCQIVKPIDQLPPQPRVQPIQPAAAPASPAPASPAPASPAPAGPAPATKAETPRQAPAAEPAPKAAPVEAPATPAASAPAPKPKAAAKPRIGSTRIMVNNLAAGSDPAAASPATAVTVRREPFTEQQLLDAWNAYIEQNPKEQVIITTMRMSQPKALDDTTYEIVVQQDAQLKFFEANKPKLMQFLRDQVGNDMLAINVKISEEISERRIFTPREVVEEIKRHNPQFEQFLNDFQLGLA